MGVLLVLLIGGLAGWLAGKVVSGGGFGLLGNIVIGILGAVVAAWLLPRLGFSAGGGVFAQILHAAIGGVVILVAIRFIKRV